VNEGLRLQSFFIKLALKPFHFQICKHFLTAHVFELGSCCLIFGKEVASLIQQ